MTGGGPITRDGAATPLGELTRIRESRERVDGALRERLLDAMLEQCGEKGYRCATVQDAIAACDTNRVQFYRHFASKAECYEKAHEERLEAFTERILAAGRGGDSWCEGLIAAMREAGVAGLERPSLMRGLLVEAHVAGGPVLATRAKTHSRLAGALDSARRELPTRHPTPSLTASFMVGAIDSSLSRALAAGRPQDFVDDTPELTQMVAAPYIQGADDPGELGYLPRVATA